VNIIGKDLEITATSLDGKVVEGLAHTRFKNVIGVQFHPENHLLYDPEHTGYMYAPDDTTMISDYTFLQQHESLEFHYTFWRYFNSRFRD
jgi:putative glutamine amidotransferase